MLYKNHPTAQENDRRARDIDRLADLIATGETDEALDLLKEIHPNLAPWPHHVQRRVADRRADAAGRAA